MSTAPPILAEPLVETTSDTGLRTNDFSDRLSPIIVKELRQGMRTKMFAITFILLQAVMALALLTSTSAGSSAAAANSFWFILCIILLFVMPQRGFNALAGEEKNQTMDLILLTRLTSWRITFGKWIAIVCISLLIVISVMPYVVLRYYVGGINIGADLMRMGIVVFFSCLLTACSVGFSAQKMVLLRRIIGLGILVLAITLTSGIMSQLNYSGFYTSPKDDWLAYAGTLALGIFTVYYLLDMGASVIAPAAENHSTRKRLASIGIIFSIAIAALFGTDLDTLARISLIITTVVSIDALTENPVLLPSVTVPFVRKGLLGRLSGYFLYPGWHTAIVFSLIMFTVPCGLLIYQGNGAPDSEDLGYLIAFTAAVLMPVVISRIFFPSTRSHFALYILLQSIIGLFSLLITIIANTTNTDEILLFGLISPYVCMAGIDNSPTRELFIICAIVTLLLYLAILTVRSIPIFQKTRDVEKRAREIIQKTESP